MSFTDLRAELGTNPAGEGGVLASLMLATTHLSYLLAAVNNDVERTPDEEMAELRDAHRHIQTFIRNISTHEALLSLATRRDITQPNHILLELLAEYPAMDLDTRKDNLEWTIGYLTRFTAQLDWEFLGIRSTAGASL